MLTLHTYYIYVYACFFFVFALNCTNLPVYCDGHHVHEGGGDVTVKQEGKHAAKNTDEVNEKVNANILAKKSPKLDQFDETLTSYSFKTCSLHRRSCTNLHKKSPNIHSSYTNLIAVRGKLKAANTRSEHARLITKAVVACDLSFGHRANASTVNRFPETQNKKTFYAHRSIYPLVGRSVGRRASSFITSQLASQ